MDEGVDGQAPQEMIRDIVTHVLPERQWPAPPEDGYDRSFISENRLKFTGGWATITVERMGTRDTILRLCFHFPEGTGGERTFLNGTPIAEGCEIWTLETRAGRQSLVGLSRELVKDQSIRPILPSLGEDERWKDILHQLYRQVMDECAERRVYEI